MSLVPLGVLSPGSAAAFRVVRGGDVQRVRGALTPRRELPGPLT
jgi:hypothetical protein